MDEQATAMSEPTEPDAGDAAAFLRSVMDGMSDGVVAVAEDRSIRFVNRAASDLLGRDAGELVGTRFPLPLEPACELPLPGRPGVTVALRAARADCLGEPLHLVTLRDVSARRRVERLRHAVLRADRRAAMVQVTRTIAHEIRNPAAFILANLAVMRDMFDELASLTEDARAGRAAPGKGPGKHPGSHHIRQSLNELREMVEDNVLGIDRMRSFLDEFRAMTQDARRPLEQVDLREVAAAACDICAPWLDARVELVRQLDEVPPLVGDRVGLLLVVVNLITNAMAALAGAPEQRIEVQTRVEDAQVHVVVRDLGRGIPAEHQEQIFDPLFLPDPEEGALGVGLAVASDIVVTHGGRIEVESTPGQGSRFVVALPPDTGLQIGDRDTAGPGEVRARVLLIDDDAGRLRELREVLARAHDLTGAHGGAQALAILDQDRDYDVVLCALAMAAMDGPEVHAALGRRAPELASRMVFIGDSSATPRIRRFVASERVLVLEKPVTPDLLLEVVERVSR